MASPQRIAVVHRVQADLDARHRDVVRRLREDREAERLAAEFRIATLRRRRTQAARVERLPPLEEQLAADVAELIRPHRCPPFHCSLCGGLSVRRMTPAEHEGRDRLGAPIDSGGDG